MALILVAAPCIVPLVLLVSDLVLNARRTDEQHLAYVRKTGELSYGKKSGAA